MIRSYLIPVYSNPGKQESIQYTATRFITCSQCGTIDKRSRVGQAFKCTACGYVAHADLNAACILSQRASVSFPKERNPCDGMKFNYITQRFI